MSARPALLRAGLLLAALLALGPTALPLAIPEAFQRAAAAESAQEYAAAADALEDAARRLPYEAYVVYRAGLADLAAGRFEGAFQRLTQTAALSGWTPTLHVAVGDAEAGRGNRAAALAQWEQASQALPDNDALLARLAAGYEADGRLAEALAALARRLQLGVTEPALLYRLALLTAATTPEAAIAPLTTVANFPSDYTARAEQLLRAVQDGLVPADDAYLFGRVGYELIQLQEWALAERALSEAVTRNPDYADAHAYLGLAQDKLGRDGTAAFQMAVDLAPESPLAQFLFGLHYRERGQSVEALPYLEAAQRLDPENPAIAAEMAGAYAARNDLPNAELWFSEAVRLAPQSPEFWLLLARFHVDYEWKVAELGLPAARMAVGLNPESALAHDALGYALIVTGDFYNGVESLAQALVLDPQLASGHYHFGLFYAIQNKSAEAREALNRALALDPDGPYGNLALKALALVP